MKMFDVAYESGYFYLVEYEPFEYESGIHSWIFANNVANGAHWSLKYKTANQRKWRCSSAMTLKIDSQIELVIEKLKQGNEVVVFTPEVQITFFIR